jgi:hypothetical protein
MPRRTLCHREQLLACFFLTLALFFVTVEDRAATPLISFVPQATYAATDLNALTTKQLIDLTIERGYATKSSSDAIVQSIDFDRVFAFLSTDELLDALRRENLIVGGASNSTITSKLQAKGINAGVLRPDGIITAMATLPGGPVLVQKSGRQLWNIATDSKDALKQSYERDRYGFLDGLTPLRLLKLLDDRIQPSSPQRKSWIAFSTQKVLSDTTSLVDKVNVQEGRTAAQTKVLTDAQPVGKRMVQITNYQIDPTWNEGLNPPLRESDGSIAKGTDGSSLYSLWLDEWEAAMKTKTQNFFTEYKNVGGQLDTVSIDIEIDWLSAYFARNIWFAGKQNLVMNDPRWPLLFSEMQQSGISDLTGFQLWYGQSDYRTVIWDSVMERRQVAAYNRAIFEPIRALYPNVKFTNYEYYNKSQTVPYGSYKKYPRSEYGIGTIQGTHQSMNLYDDGIPTVRKDGTVDETSSSTATSYELFIEDVQGMRTMAATSTVPIMPWIAHPDYAEARKQAPDHVYYPEAIFHTGLNGVDQYLLWVWSELKSIIGATRWDTGMRTLDASLKELSDVAGYEGGKTVSFSRVDYQDDYVLTGYEVANKRVWRLTPRPGTPVSITSQSNPVVFTINGKRIEFSLASSITSHNPTVSNLGYWITETQGRTSLNRSADDVFALLQQETASSSSSVSSVSSSSAASVSSASSMQSSSASSHASSAVSSAASTSSIAHSSQASIASTPSQSSSNPPYDASASSLSFGEGYAPVLVSDTDRTLSEEEEAQRLARADRRVVDSIVNGKLHGAAASAFARSSSTSIASEKEIEITSSSSSMSPSVTAPVSKVPQLQGGNDSTENDTGITWADFPMFHTIWNWLVALWHWITTKATGAWQWASSQVIVSE